MKIKLEFDTSTHISEKEAEEIFELAESESTNPDDVIAQLVREGLQHRKSKSAVTTKPDLERVEV